MSESAMELPQVTRIHTVYSKQQEGYNPEKPGSIEGSTKVLPPVEQMDRTAEIPPVYNPTQEKVPSSTHPSTPMPQTLINDTQKGSVNWMGWIIVGLILFGLAPVGIIFGHVALSDLKRSRRTGSRFWIITVTVIAYVTSLPLWIFLGGVILTIFGF